MLKVLFFLEPLFELNAPFRMQEWVQWYSRIHDGLKSSLPNYDARLVALDLIDFTHYYGFEGITVSLTPEELRQGVEYTGNVFLNSEHGRLDVSPVGHLITEKLDGFEPDVVFLLSESKWLRESLPNVVFLNFELNWFHYAPYPKNWSIDVAGYGKGRVLSEYSELIFNDMDFHDDERRFTDHFIASVQEKFSSPPSEVVDFMNKLKERFSKIILIPLGGVIQGDGETNVFASLSYYFSQVEFNDTCYLVTSHPSTLALNSGEIRYFVEKYSNVVVESQPRPYSYTQYAIPFVDEVVSDFSSVAYHALFFDKKIISIKEFLPYEDDFSDYIAPLAQLISKSNKEECLRILYWLITYYAVSDEKFFSGVWMARFINKAISSVNNKAPYELYDTKIMTEDEWMETSWMSQKVKDEYFYQKWFNQRYILPAGQLVLSDNKAENVEIKVHFVMKLLPEQIELLADTLDCIAIQTSEAWTLTVVASFESPSELFDEVDALHWVQVEKGYGFNRAINEVVKTISSGWFAFVEAGIQLEPIFIHSCQQYIVKLKEWKYIYLDEDTINHKGLYCLPKFKPDFDPDLLRSTPYIGTLCLVDYQALSAIGGLSEEYAVDSYDLALKVLDFFGAEAIGHLPEVLVHVPEPNLEYYDEAETFKALSSHIQRNSLDVEVVRGWVDRSFRLKYAVTGNPAVSILIHPFSGEFLTKRSEQFSLLKACVTSILEKTSYLDFDIVIANKESSSKTEYSFNEIKEIDSEKINVVEYSESYNVAAINNLLVDNAKGDYVVFLQPNTEVLQDSWLYEMLGLSQRSKVAVVGARLISSSKLVLHAGEVLGLGEKGVVGRPHLKLSMDSAGYMNRAMVVQNFSAVSSTCMMMKKSIYKQLNGMDEGKFKICFAEEDLCLRVKALGYRVLFTPFATLIYNELKRNNKVVDQIQFEADVMQEKWLPQLANDPAYNRNLSLKTTNFKVDSSMNVTWNVDFKNKPRVYAFAPDRFGVGQYRVRGPIKALTQAEMIESALVDDFSQIICPTPTEIERIQPDVLFLQNGFLDKMRVTWEKYKQFNNAFMVCGLDDLVYMLPHKHPMQGVWPKNLRRKVKEFFLSSDRLIVANDALAEEFRKMADEIVVVPNYLEVNRWRTLALPEKKQAKKLRVGWAGGEQHITDLEFILPVVKALYKEVDWIFMGLCIKELKPFVKEIHLGVEFDLYPQKLANLNLDLAIAPLGHNKFNECKTNLRLLEYGVLGWPVVCSDILPYQSAPVTRVGNNTQNWIKIIREKINEPDALREEGLVLQQWVIANYILEDHLEEWYAALMP